MDASAFASQSCSRTDRAKDHETRVVLRDLQSGDHSLASSAVLQRGDGEPQHPHCRAPDFHGGGGADVVATDEPAPRAAASSLSGAGSLLLSDELADVS